MKAWMLGLVMVAACATTGSETPPDGPPDDPPPDLAEDFDEDGLPDDEDLCPEEHGFETKAGCPDVVKTPAGTLMWSIAVGDKRPDGWSAGFRKRLREGGEALVRCFGAWKKIAERPRYQLQGMPVRADTVAGGLYLRFRDDAFRGCFGAALGVAEAWARPPDALAQVGRIWFIYLRGEGEDCDTAEPDAKPTVERCTVP